MDIDTVTEWVRNSRADADYFASNGGSRESLDVTLSIEDCGIIGELLTQAFGAVLMGERDAELANTLALLASAFTGEGVEDDES